MKKKITLPRVPLPRQTGGVHKAAKGGKYDRNQSRREAKAELDSARRAIREGY